MKLSLVFFTFILLFSGCTPNSSLSEQEKLLSSIKKLFKVLNLPTDGSLIQMNEIAQKKLLRKPGQERWDMDKEAYTDKKEQILPILDEIGLLQEKKPSRHNYDYILVLGALVNRMRDRLQFLDKIWPSLDKQTQKNIKIAFLVGERTLDPTQENTEVLLNEPMSPVPFRSGWVAPQTLPKTEKEAAEFLWDQIITNKDLKKKKDQEEVLFVNTPQKGDPPKRPTTVDTIFYWINSQQNPKFLRPKYTQFWDSSVPLDKARYLVISNNPFILFQHKVVQNSLRKKGIINATIETVGSAADTTVPLSVHLDNVARILYEEVASVKN